jgi:hypothetical protein
VYITKEPTPKKKKKTLSLLLTAFVGNLEEDEKTEDQDITSNGFERIMEHCCENHAKHTTTVVRAAFVF